MALHGVEEDEILRRGNQEFLYRCLRESDRVVSFG